jgi:hypothetical protein
MLESLSVYEVSNVLCKFLDLADHFSLSRTSQVLRIISQFPFDMGPKISALVQRAQLSVINTINSKSMLYIPTYHFCEDHCGNGSMSICSMCLCITCGSVCGTCDSEVCAIVTDDGYGSFNGQCATGCDCNCKFICWGECNGIVCTACEPDGPTYCETCKNNYCVTCVADHDCAEEVSDEAYN